MPGPVSDAIPDLATRMRGFAQSHPEHAEEFEVLIEKLEAAIASGEAPRILGAWARMRKRYYAVSGERDTLFG